MPHAVFEPAPPLEHFWRVFAPFKEVRPDRTIIEARSSYLRHDRGSLIIEAFAFEVGPPQHFFVICDQRGSRVTVRCAPLVPVSRSDGVLEIVRRIAVQFREAGGTLLRTNLDLDPLPAPALEGGGE
ncbi:MAG: hypothetical protein ACYTGJ_06020 [Planctomycetota bacterium]|jgi:hypothetical protein